MDMETETDMETNHNPSSTIRSITQKPFKKEPMTQKADFFYSKYKEIILNLTDICNPVT